MWSIWKTVLLIAVIGVSDFPKAGADPAGPSNPLFDLRNNLMTKLWTRKMRTFFRRLDFNDDGIITRQEFQGMAERFADLEKFTPEEKEKAIKAFNDFFTICTKAAGTSDGNTLTEELLIESIKLQRNDPALAKTVDDVLMSLFTPMKVEQKGYFTKDEYRRIFENVGISQSAFATVGFAMADTDHDGRVSAVEVYDASLDYVCSGDESSTALFGLLV